MDCFHHAEGCADFMCVLRGPVSDLGLVPLGYKAWCWITTLLGPARAERRGGRRRDTQRDVAAAGVCCFFCLYFLLTSVFLGELLFLFTEKALSDF